MAFLGNVKMKPKLIALFLLVGLVPLAVVGWRAQQVSEQALMERAYDQLASVRAIKRQQLEEFFATRQEEMRVLMNTVAALEKDAFAKLRAVTELKKEHVEDYMGQLRTQLKVLRDDPYTMQALKDINSAAMMYGVSKDTDQWLEKATKYDPRFSDIIQDNGWNDIVLVHPRGRVIYTRERKDDLGQNCKRGLADTVLGKAYAKASQMGDDEIAVVDYEPYAPFGGQQVAFMMARMVDSRDRLVGYLGFQVPMDRINAIVQDRRGMADSGESYLVALQEDGAKLRSDLTTMDGEQYGVGAPVSTAYLDRLMASGEVVSGVFVDSQGTPSVVLAEHMDMALDWGIVSKVDLEDVIVPTVDGREYFDHFIEEFQYYDLFLIHPEGRIFYTVAHEADYGTNLLDGPYAESNLGELFREVMQSGEFGIVDFEPYAPSNGEPAAFIAQPYVQDGVTEFVVALQISPGPINALLEQREGMGETGETYLVGPDMRLRSKTFRDPQQHSMRASFAGSVAENGADTETARLALAGESGARMSRNYLGDEVLSAYAPVRFKSIEWGLLAEKGRSEVRTPVAALSRTLQITAGIIAIAVAALAFFVALSISRPIERTASFARAVARGDFSRAMPVSQKDEVGLLAQSVERIPATLRELTQEFDAQTRDVQQGRLRRRGDAGRFQGDFSHLLANANALSDVYTAYLDRVPLPLMNIDRQMHITFINQAGASAGGGDPLQLEDTPCSKHYDSDHCGSQQCVCARAMQHGEEAKGSTRARLAQGERELDCTAIPIRDAEGKVVGAMEVAVDNTAILRQQRQVLRLANESTDISGRLSSAAEQLSAQVEQASKGAETQSQRAGETATSMEQMNATVLEVAQNASLAAENADSTRAKAEEGAAVVNRVVDAIHEVHDVTQGLRQNMSNLGEQADAIGRIMNVITDIADQTNLLALNAAIEAARAGEAGKGFAVVADEVRKLAEKTMNATDEVGASIQAIQEGTRQTMADTDRAAQVVEESTELARSSGRSLQEIVQLAENTADQVRAIATASEQQSAASEQVTRATEEINRVSDETSNVMRESSQAVTEVAGLAQNLNTLIEEMSG